LSIYLKLVCCISRLPVTAVGSGMVLLLLISFISGCLLTAVSIAAGILFWFYTQSVSVEKESVDGDEGAPYIQPHLPQVSIAKYLTYIEQCQNN